MSEDVIIKEIQIEKPISSVWQALTDYRKFGQWFRVHLEGPFIPGQKTSGYITWPGYEHLRWEAVVQKIEPETLFSFTWHPYAIDPNVDYSSEEPTLVEFTLTPTASGTHLRVTESGFSKIPEHRRDEAFLRNGSGWAQQVENIKTYVAATP